MALQNVAYKNLAGVDTDPFQESENLLEERKKNARDRAKRGLRRIFIFSKEIGVRDI